MLLWKHKEREEKSQLWYIDGHLSSRNAELAPKLRKYKGRVVLGGDIVKDDSGACAVFTEKGSSASQMTAAKVMDAIARLPNCDGQAGWCRISIQSGKIGRCSQVALNSKVRLPMYTYIYI